MLSRFEATAKSECESKQQDTYSECDCDPLRKAIRPRSQSKL